ncbi:MAG: LysR substrate-binding domain-containing protein, partial [Lautropia sp.]
MNLSGRLLEAFLALDETRRFVVAADRCHVTPSAFSQMIGRLEAQVGVRLFDRDTRNVSLTAEGEVFAASARRISAEFGAAMEKLRDRASLNVGSVTIAAPPSLAAAWLPGLLAEFRSRHPSISLGLRDVVSDRCLELVLDGHVDFGINARHGSGLEFETVLQRNERFFLLCRDSDPLADGSGIRLKDLRGRDFIHLVRTGSAWQRIRDDLTRAGVRDAGFEVEQFSTVAGLVSAGFGVSVVPELALPLCQRPGLRVVRVADK